MSPREEEEFELVLGNKQLLSLFFLVVVLFGVFFSFGYTVGYGRGENSRTVEVGGTEPGTEPSQQVQLPDALLQDAPRPTEPAAKAEPSTSTAAAPAPVSEEPKPRPVAETPRPAPPPAQASTPAKTAPAKTAPANASAQRAQPSGQAVTRSAHLQISAVRVRRDAEVYVEQLRAKGHPAAVSDQGDGWFRVVVGPFNSDAEAQSYQGRLRQEGVDSLLRR
jgi:cell division protein FtsN